MAGLPPVVFRLVMILSLVGLRSRASASAAARTWTSAFLTNIPKAIPTHHVLSTPISTQAAHRPLWLPLGRPSPPATMRGRALFSSAKADDDGLQVRASHILVPTEEKADMIVQQLSGGEDFGELAKAESSCPSKAMGGDLSWFGRGMMVPEFEQACYNNPVGTVVKAKTQFGWHVIKVTGKLRAPMDMTVGRLGDILNDAGLVGEYQLIDVREKNELDTANIKKGDFVNLPTSEVQQWGPKIIRGELLDKSKKTIVMCHHGGRSMQVANFLAAQAGFEEVYNVAGGIHQYALQVDSSIATY